MKTHPLLSFTVLVAAVAALAVGESRAQEQPAQQQAAPQPSPEQVVLSKMHQLNQMEMQMGRLAWERGSAELVRNLGERLFRDHRLGDNKVTSLAQAQNIELLPLGQLPDVQKMKQLKQKMQQLKQAQGAQFDQMFLQMVVQSHDMAIQTLSQALEQKLQDGEVSGLVKTLLPILEQHRTLAQHVQA